MIAYLSGKIILEKPGFAIVETSGIGYKVFVNNLDIADREEAKLFIHEQIREDTDDFYGFATYDQLELFQKLISVNGVGPKAAMAIMTISSVEKISQAIISGDLNFFQAVPGIGKKVAAKIILELKSKIAKLESSDIINQIDQGDEVAEALISLGYKKSEIAKILSQAPKDISVEQKIRWCLKNMTK